MPENTAKPQNYTDTFLGVAIYALLASWILIVNVWIKRLLQNASYSYTPYDKAQYLLLLSFVESEYLDLGILGLIAPVIEFWRCSPAFDLDSVRFTVAGHMSNADPIQYAVHEIQERDAD